MVAFGHIMRNGIPVIRHEDDYNLYQKKHQAVSTVSWLEWSNEHVTHRLAYTVPTHSADTAHNIATTQVVSESTPLPIALIRIVTHPLAHLSTHSTTKIQRHNTTNTIHE
jgi:hypothetical protein